MKGSQVLQPLRRAVEALAAAQGEATQDVPSPDAQPRDGPGETGASRRPSLCAVFLTGQGCVFVCVQ